MPGSPPPPWDRLVRGTAGRVSEHACSAARANAASGPAECSPDEATLANAGGPPRRRPDRARSWVRPGPGAPAREGERARMPGAGAFRSRNHPRRARRHRQAQPGPAGRRFGPAGSLRQPGRHAEDQEVLGRGEVWVERGPFDQRPDAGDDRGSRTRWLAQEARLARGRPEEAEQQPDRGRLARAVRAKEAEDAAGGHHEVDGVHGPDRPEGPRETARLDRRFQSAPLPKARWRRVDRRRRAPAQSTRRLRLPPPLRRPPRPDARHRAAGRAPSGAGSGRGSSAPSRPASGTTSRG